MRLKKLIPKPPPKPKKPIVKYTGLNEDEDDDFDAEPPRKKPKRDVAVVPPKKHSPPTYDDRKDEDNEQPEPVRLLPGVTKTTLRRINTMFGQRSDTIIDMLESSDTDSASALITRTLLQTLVDVLPVVERGVRKSKGTRGVMPLNQCISQIREVIHDLQAFKDRSSLGQNIVDRNVRPAYLDLAVQVSNLFVEQENYIRTRIGKEDFEKFQEFNTQMKRSLADFIRKQYEEVSASIVKSV